MAGQDPKRPNPDRSVQYTVVVFIFLAYNCFLHSPASHSILTSRRMFCPLERHSLASRDSFFPFAVAVFCHRIASTAKSSVRGGVVGIFEFAGIFFLIVVLYLLSAIKILREYERGVIFIL